MLVRILALVAIVFVFVAAAGCGGEDAATTEEPATEQTPDATATAGTAEVAGRDQFVETCGSCHTLSDAGTNGQIGPNLDDVAPGRGTGLDRDQDRTG